MTAEVEANGWAALVAAITGTLSFVGGIIATQWYRATGRATDEGRNEGSVSAWRAAIEARVSRMEAETIRTDDILRQVPTRAEMKSDLDRNMDRVRADMTSDLTSIRMEMREGMKSLGLHISQISALLYENRNAAKRD